ncbi:MAG: ATP-binding protein [Oscillospiraceae bacterium]|nr:ATP-binding protein [Oscillospiraceae bacterium]
MFVGRERELKKLNEMYAGDRFECAIIYGRRRVGKTSLIQEFIRDKKSIYFLSLETSQRVNLENFSKSVWNVAMKNIKAPPRFANFTDALETVGDLADDERIVLVIDEYPYLANSVKGMSSILQAQIDMRFKNSKLFLILCGSSMSFMEYQVLGYKSPLYGRRTAQFKVQPFNFFESISFHEKYDAYDSAVVYGITGGIPQYLAQIDGKKSVKKNIIESFFDPASYLFEEPSNLLKQELREPQMYNDIIIAIATGSSRLNEIATKTGLVTAACSKYLSSLISLGIVKKERPILAEKSKKTIYRLADNMFRFWYRFVPQNISQIQSGAGERVYGSIEQQIPSYMGEVFEEICKQYLWKENLAERLPFYFRDAGRWWGTNPVRRREQEIDIIAFDDTRAIFCECKWTREPVGGAVLDDLVEKSLMFNYKEKHYFLFSKSGFTVECKKNAGNNVKLIEFRDMATGTSA